ncbi:hypothetical protein HUO13_16715 [Saccharopolyspora erythraea]|uniref:Rv0361 family membrane protein n=1 Tax=Saccharopolyspora erythraea TaxID=1836 RepID=UPI001BAD3A18|nr:hypothetical protein [Saccharopolyspora erythraea]QUH02219.1 hypothetical protein HUO13_16715 [Saccharopolyspora erythraea]
MTPAPQEPGRSSSDEPDNSGGPDNSGELSDNQAAGSEEHATPAESEKLQEADQQAVDQQDADEQAADQQEADEQAVDQQAAGQAGEAEAVPAKKRKTGLVVGIAAAVLVIAGGAAAGYVYLWGASAQSVAEDYAALTTQETQDPRSVTAESYRPFVCSQAMPQIEQLQQEKGEFLKVARPQDLEQLKTVKTSVKSVQESGDSGTVALESTIPGQPPQSTNLKLTKEDGDWKLCA